MKQKVKQVKPQASATPFSFIRNKDGAKPLSPALTPEAIEGPLHIAWVVPPYSKGSGGHMTIFNIIHNLEQMGHSCSIWIHDPDGYMRGNATVRRREICDYFRPVKAAVFDDFSQWFGADVAMATGWQTAYPLQQLKNCALKAYFVQDHEPEFYPQSVERLWAEDTYRWGLPCITASKWLADIQEERYGARAYPFQLGVDFEHYRDLSLERDPDTVVFYARTATARRGVSLGLLALEEVLRRRPQTRAVLFGWYKPPSTSFAFDFLGIASSEQLADLYNRAAVGLNISLTNYSLIPQEMMACGLPVVEVEGFSAETVFGSDGSSIELAEPEPGQIANKIIELLENRSRREQLSTAAKEFVSGHTWRAAAEQVLEGLKAELRLRQR